MHRGRDAARARSVPSAAAGARLGRARPLRRRRSVRVRRRWRPNSSSATRRARSTPSCARPRSTACSSTRPKIRRSRSKRECALAALDAVLAEHDQVLADRRRRPRTRDDRRCDRDQRVRRAAASLRLDQGPDRRHRVRASRRRDRARRRQGRQERRRLRSAEADGRFARHAGRHRRARRFRVLPEPRARRDAVRCCAHRADGALLRRVPGRPRARADRGRVLSGTRRNRADVRRLGASVDEQLAHLAVLASAHGVAAELLDAAALDRCAAFEAAVRDSGDVALDGARERRAARAPRRDAAGRARAAKSATRRWA